MPYVVTIPGRGPDAGTRAFFSREEADAKEIPYFVPPLSPADINFLFANYVLTANDYVVPIIGYDGIGHYTTPFGRCALGEWPIASGYNVGMDKIRSSQRFRDIQLLAHWTAQLGDAELAHRFACGGPVKSKKKLENLVRSDAFQLALREEMKTMKEAGVIPIGQIIEARMRHLERIDAVLAHIEKKILDGEELGDQEIKLFRDVAKDQRENLTDLEVGYVRTPPEPEDDSAELTFRLRAANAQRSLPRAKQPEDDMRVPTRLSDRIKLPEGIEPVQFETEEAEATQTVKE